MKKITLEDFSHDIKSRENLYIIVQRNEMSPVRAGIHISDVTVIPTYPEIISAYDGCRNGVTICCIKSIELHDGFYRILCGSDENEEAVVIRYDCEKQQ